MSGLLSRLKTRKTGSNDSSSSPFFEEEGFVCPICHQKFGDQTLLTLHFTDPHAHETRQAPTPSFSDSNTRETAMWKQQFSVSEESRVLLSNELIQEKERSTNLEEELQLVQKQLKTSQAKISEQLLEIGNLKATKDVYDAQLTIFSNELVSAQNQLKEKQQQLDILSSKASSDDLDVLKHELVRIQQTMNDISIEKEKEIERLQSILVETQQKLNTIETKFQRTNTFLGNVITKLIIPANNEINQLKQLIKKQKEKSETILKHIRNSLIEKQNIIRHLNETLEQQKQINQSQSIQNQQLEKLLHEKNQLIETKLEGAEKQDLLRQMSAEKNLFEQHNKEFRNQITELSSQRQQIQSDYEKISKQFTLISNEKNQLQNQLNNINRDKDKQTNELTVLHEKYNSIQQTNDLLIKEKQELEQNKSQQIEHITRLEQNVQLIQKEKDTIVQQLQSTLSHLHVKLEHRDNRIKRLSIGIQHSIVLSHRVLERINENIPGKQLEMFKLIETAENNARIIREKTLEDIQFEFRNSLTTIHSIICKYKTQFETNQSNLLGKDEQIKKLKNTYESINKQYQEQKLLFEQLTELTQTMDRQREKYEKQINSLEQELESRTKRHEKQIAALTENLSSVRTELKQNQEKLTLIDQIKAEKTDIEARLSVSQDERRVLLERSLSNEQKNEKLITENGLLSKKAIETESALQEIAREYQVLQILVNKLSQRRWIDDEDVDACMKCNHTFSVTQRKHHCRNCGNIFCDNCSSKTATIAASRKQKRVCDQCYKDLTS